MAPHDLVVRAGRVVTPDGVQSADVAVSNGVVTAVEPDVPGDGYEEIDATGLHVLPGVVDAHVHFNDPGRSEWEGFATGSAALAAGGATCFVDMPLNSLPPVLDGAAFDRKVAAAAGISRVDFGLWGGLVPTNLDRMAELATRGVVGFKAFMCASGVEEFARADDVTLTEGMARAADLGLPVLVHAESEEITGAATAATRAAGRLDLEAYLATRPAAAELDAIARALEIAARTGCSLHVVHVSTAAGVRAIRDASADATCETCPHYLLLGDDDLVRLGGYGKAAPPPRPSEREALWRLVASGDIPVVASDHSPAPPAMKEGLPYLDLWGGISGCQSTLGLMLAAGYADREIPLPAIVAAVATTPARRFDLAGKGTLAAGFDADMVLVDLDHEAPLSRDDLRYRHPRSAFEGMPHRGRIVRTLLRGVTVSADGTDTSEPIGQLVRPTSGRLTA